jgi:hypothetical protein
VVVVGVMIRFGLVALTAALAFSSILDGFPITTDTAAWYAGVGYLGIFLMALMIFYGFNTARGGRAAVAGAPAFEQ